MPVKEDEAVQVVAALYEAALRPEHWPEALEGLRVAFDSGASNAFVQDTETGKIPLWLGAGTEDVEDDYIEHLRFINPRARFSMTHRPGTVAWDYRVLTERAMDRHPFYDWLSQFGFRYSMGTRLFEDGPLNGFVAVNWAPSHGHADEKDIALFRRLQPHLERTLRLTIETRRHEAQSSALEAAMHLFDFGVVLLDACGTVVFANEFAERIFSRNDGLGIREGQLSAAKSADRRTLNELIASALSAREGDEWPPAATALVSRRPHVPPYMVSVAPVTDGLRARIPGEATVIVMIRDSAARTPSIAVLRQIYGLTEREAELAAGLQQTGDLAEAAETLQIAHNTAKVHLRAIFLKTGTRSQAQLARLLAGLPPHPFA